MLQYNVILSTIPVLLIRLPNTLYCILRAATSEHSVLKRSSAGSQQSLFSRQTGYFRGVQEPFLSGWEYSEKNSQTPKNSHPDPQKLPPTLGGSTLKNKKQKIEKFPPTLGGSRSDFFVSLPPRFFKIPTHSGWESLLRSESIRCKYFACVKRKHPKKFRQKPSRFTSISQKFRRLRRAKTIVLTSKTPKFSVSCSVRVG